MQTIDNKTFELYHNGGREGRLVYSSDAFNNGILEASLQYVLNAVTTGVWTTTLQDEKQNIKIVSWIKVETGGIISLRFPGKKKKYAFRKSAGWKLRFSLSQKDGEEILSIIPSVNWQKSSHDFVLQLNEEFETECNAFLILQAVHCANCCLSMMNGGKVPALISI